VPAGTRIEATERYFQAIEDKIREVIPDRDRQLIVDNIGLPARYYNLAFGDGSTIGANDGVIMVSLKEGHAPTADYVRKLREVLPATFSDVTFYFQAADVVTQILNFGLPAQIDVRTIGQDKANNLKVAEELRERVAAIPGVTDAHLQQQVDGPAFEATIDRTRAAQLGLSTSAIANNINVSLSSSQQVSPNFWTDPATGIPYYLAVQTPQYWANSLNDLRNTPVASALSPNGNVIPGMLSNVVTLNPTRTRPTFSPSMTFMPASRIAISALSQAKSRRSSANSRQSSSQATPSSSPVRSKAWRTAFAISASASCSLRCSCSCSWW
jgi:multidrug efflux pump subunit AcrB